MMPRKYVRAVLRTVGLLLATFCVVLLVDRFGEKLNPHRPAVRTGGGVLRGGVAGTKPGRPIGDSIFAKSKDFLQADEPHERVEGAAAAASVVQASRRKVLNGKSRSADDGALRPGRKKRKSQKKKAAAAASVGGGGAASSDFQSIDVVVNNEQHIGGFMRAEDSDVYLPFKFVKKYFDVYGDVKSSGGVRRLVFSHSYGRPFSPPKTYKHHSSGAFINFGTFNVASRERVLYLDECNVPVSAQWDPKGFHFATQISQFGLQHYSAMVEPKNKSRTEWIINPGHIIAESWISNAKSGNKLRIVRDDKLARDVVSFCTEEPVVHLTAITGITHKMATLPPAVHVLHAVFKMTGEAMAISVRVMMSDGRLFTLHYDTTATKTLEVQAESVRYRLVATAGQWKTFARDLQIDIQRAIVFQVRSKESTKSRRESASGVKATRIQSITLRGCGAIANMSIRSEAHYQMAMDAADWLISNQNTSTGGWPTQVVRTLKPTLVMQPGWYSAMVQGQAMSLLVRAYYASKNKKYLDAARKATGLFHKLARDGGVRAVFLKEYTWYEEYPTQPSSFVLNGFIFSLLGLYDLAEASQSAGVSSDAEKLYKDGLRSLKAMAMLYDTGVGTIYDLRHFSISTFPPNRARWDYHVTHINLMTAMSSIDPDPLFPALRARWLGYMVGKATKHN